MRGLRGVDPERGDSLIEIVMALTILGLTVVAVFSGITLSIRTSDAHRKQTTASVYVRDYAETIEKTVAAGGYADGTGFYPTYVPTDSRYTASALPAQCGPGTSWTSCSAGTDIGLQKLTLQVSDSSGRALEQLVIIVRKPCATSPSC
jgi:Tfp pilus assembly protein PilX